MIVQSVTKLCHYCKYNKLYQLCHQLYCRHIIVFTPSSIILQNLEAIILFRKPSDHAPPTHGFILLSLTEVPNHPFAQSYSLKVLPMNGYAY